MKNSPLLFWDLPTLHFDNIDSGMMHWVRTFFGMLQIASILVAVTVTPSNASAMISCSVEQVSRAPSNERHHHVAEITAADVDHEADHCTSHICVVADFVGPSICTKRSAMASLRSWDIAPLVRSATPDGLLRPPQF